MPHKIMQLQVTQPTLLLTYQDPGAVGAGLGLGPGFGIVRSGLEGQRPRLGLCAGYAGTLRGLTGGSASLLVSGGVGAGQPPDQGRSAMPKAVQRLATAAVLESERSVMAAYSAIKQ